MTTARLKLSLAFVLIAALIVGALFLSAKKQPQSNKTAQQDTTEELDLSKAQPVFPTSLAELKETAKAPDLDIKTWETESGAKVLFLGTEQIPMLTTRLTFNAGGARDGNKPGLASLTNKMLDQGSKKHDVTDIAEGFENLGAELDLGSYRDMAVATLTSLSEDDLLDDAVTLFSQVLSQPEFPEDAFQRERTRALQRLKMEKQTPSPQLSRKFQSLLFAKHPYGQPAAGTEDSLNNIEREDLAEFYRNNYTASNATIAIVGDVSEKRARKLSDSISQALPQGDAPDELPMAKQQPNTNEHIEFDSTQTHITIGNQMIHRGHPDYPALYVGNHILGGSGFSAILMDEVRQKRGLVYGISSSVSPMAAGGPFTIKLQTANDNKDEALDLTLSLLEDFVEEGPTEEQLALAISDLTANFALSTASNSALVGQLSAIGFYDLPLDYLSEFYEALSDVSRDDIKAAFQKHLDPSQLVIASIGPEAPKRTKED